MRIIFILLGGILISGCSKYVFPTDETTTDLPAAPDYSNESAWAALPSKLDNADRTPDPSLTNDQDKAVADVFFLHPTTYTGGKEQDKWNGPIDDPKLNEKTDESTILHQASVFNGAARVFAPRYRQAHIHAYYSKNEGKARRAFAAAYADVKEAFKYYLEHYNEGRPIIIAGHSQGTTHAGKLLQEFFDGQELQEQLVAAYLIGMPVRADYFKNIKPCNTSAETNCFCSWRTWERGHIPKYWTKAVVTNPLTWTMEKGRVGATENQGGVLRRFKGIEPGLADAEIHDSVLWVTKPKFFGSFLVNMKNYHIADYNLFYVNIRENAKERVAAFVK